MLVYLVAIVATPIALFHSLTYLLWLYEARVHGPAAPREARLPKLTAWLGEGLALTLVVLAWPFGLVGTRRVTRTAAGRPVVLVPGWGMNRSSFALLAARLRRDGRDAYAINYPSAIRDPQRMARAVADEIARVARESRAPVIDVIAHGQGGVLVRAAARQEEVQGRLGNLVTVGSPHRGTALARFVRLANLRHLALGSPYVGRLLEDDTVPATKHFVAIYSTFDAIVFPPEAAYYPGAMNVTIDAVGHMGLLLSERVYVLAKENIDVEPRSAPQQIHTGPGAGAVAQPA
jgi:pimeloyl-ACP methyl ester carboxylesterase